MKTNNIISAPQLDTVDDIYLQWKKEYGVGRNKFYDFMTTPSAERSRFIEKCQLKISSVGAVVKQTVFI